MVLTLHKSNEFNRDRLYSYIPRTKKTNFFVLFQVENKVRKNLCSNLDYYVTLDIGGKVSRGLNNNNDQIEMRKQTAKNKREIKTSFFSSLLFSLTLHFSD